MVLIIITTFPPNIFPILDAEEGVEEGESVDDNSVSVEVIQG